MKANRHGLRGIALCWARWYVLGVTVLGAPAFAQDGAKVSSDTLEEVVVPPGPAARISRGAFANNPGCIHAKLDLWTGRGRYSYQLFTGGQTRDDEKTATHVMLDTEVTTILIGRDGCRAE